jgi:acetyl-CoA carboxylase biotin carboxylase subunit
MLDKVVIANRGEIALRILRACRELGIKTVAVHSTADYNLKHVLLADESVCIGPAPSPKSYLNMPAIISAAEVTDSVAIHPGYGFLSENADFAERVEKSGFIFIGPKADVIRADGRQGLGHQDHEAAGVPCVPGSGGRSATTATRTCASPRTSATRSSSRPPAAAAAAACASCTTKASLLNAINVTKAEALAAFGNDQVYMEKFLERPRHIEFQVLADNYGNVIHLGERDCSMQRRHQKVIEEAPAPGITRRSARRWASAWSRPAGRGLSQRRHARVPLPGRRVLLHRDEHAHPGRAPGDRAGHRHRPRQGAAADRGRREAPYVQKDIEMRGHAIECRINAEDAKTFMPSPGPSSCGTRRAAPASASTATSTPATTCRRTTIR